MVAYFWRIGAELAMLNGLVMDTCVLFASAVSTVRVSVPFTGAP